MARQQQYSDFKKRVQRVFIFRYFFLNTALCKDILSCKEVVIAILVKLRIFYHIFKEIYFFTILQRRAHLNYKHKL